MLNGPAIAINNPMDMCRSIDETSPLVALRGVTRTYGATIAVHPLDLKIPRGEFLAILGPSGCGKTTLLRMIGGFVAPTAGSIHIGGQDVTRIPPERRPTNLVFQGYGLFPHMTVAQNIGYGLRIKKTPMNELERRVREVVELVHLEGLSERMVTQLSGGQAQRVALARALVMRPEVLLLDEPLAALDLKLRKSMQEELRRIHTTTGGTFVFVTHDQEEAMALATRICVMKDGEIVQDDRPEVIYSHPISRFVSTFIGEANVFPGTRRNGHIFLEVGLNFPNAGDDGPVVCVVRPERVRVSSLDDVEGLGGYDNRASGHLEDAIFLGPFVKYTVRLKSGTVVKVDSRDMKRRDHLPLGERVEIGWRAQDQQILDDKD